MIDPVALRSTIATILKPYIGIYRFPDGSMGDALAVLPDTERGWLYPESGTKTSGLEILIKQPYPDAQSNIGGDRMKTYIWEIHLLQWDTNKSVRDALSKLTSELPAEYLIDRVSVMPASDRLLTLDQCKVFLKEWSVVAAEL